MANEAKAVPSVILVTGWITVDSAQEVQIEHIKSRHCSAGSTSLDRVASVGEALAVHHLALTLTPTLQRGLVYGEAIDVFSSVSVRVPRRSRDRRRPPGTVELAEEEELAD
ncbi:unnamed protein product [Gadus morhua 'NCC']